MQIHNEEGFHEKIKIIGRDHYDYHREIFCAEKRKKTAELSLEEKAIRAEKRRAYFLTNREQFIKQTTEHKRRRRLAAE